MKRLIFTFAMLVVAAVAWAQSEPVQWKAEFDQSADGVQQISFRATIDEGWHIYDLPPVGEGGPMPTEFTFTPSADYELVGEPTSTTEPQSKYDEIYGMRVRYFEQQVVFVQQIRLLAPHATIKAAVDWMSCNEGSCMVSDKDFEIVAQGTAATAPAAVVDAAAGVAAPAVEVKSGSIWGFVLQAIAWALVALLTPCVFPMIPMTVSFFLKGSKTAAQGRFRASMYGVFIVLLYTVPICGIIFTTWLIGGDAVTADIFNWVATHWLPNLVFFAVFMIFAASFFGAFDIVLPSSIVNSSDEKSDKRGLLGVFFMALTLVLVSFSCTGPIVGTVLIQSTSGEFWTPMLTIFAFAVVFALPFTLFALFPSWLNRMPKSGGWLNSVKVVLGFAELALGLKFLSVADQTYHWGILDREVYLALWIAIFSLLGMYLLGKIRFKHDTPTESLSVMRLILAIFTFAFVVYLVPGMWGAPLKAISGYLPPLQTQDFNVGAASIAAPSAQTASVKYGDKLHLPLGLQGYFDIEEAKTAAAEQNKPLFIAFTGHGCVNCREMEARVWADPAVLQILRDDYVVCALYADDKMTVDKADWVTTDTGKVLKGLGKINSYYALKNYGVNAQPYYILQGADRRQLAEPRGYDLSVESFVDFLRGGLAKYRAEQNEQQL